MSNILAVTSDRYAALTPAQITAQADNLTPLTVTFDAAAIALFGANPAFRIDWQLADGTELYSGNYPVAASTALTIPDSVLAQAGALQYQIRVSDDSGLVWHTIKGYTILPEAIEAGTPATPDTRVYVESPLTFTTGNIPGYLPASGRMTDSGYALSLVQDAVDNDAARGLLEVYSGSHAYVVGNKVTYQGSTYQCILASTGNLPTSGTYWIQIAAKGDTGQAGATGQTGQTGATGTSAYQAAVAGGYSAAESQFNTDLAGMQGLASALAAIVG